MRRNARNARNADEKYAWARKSKRYKQKYLEAIEGLLGDGVGNAEKTAEAKTSGEIDTEVAKK